MLVYPDKVRRAVLPIVKPARGSSGEAAMVAQRFLKDIFADTQEGLLMREFLEPYVRESPDYDV